MTLTVATLANAPLPLLPLQILFLNLVTDVFPALALAAGEGNPGIMKLPPRVPGEAIVTRKHWLAVAAYAFIMTASVLGALALALMWLEMDEKRAVTISFLTLAFAQLWHVFNMRDSGSALIRNDITTNPFVWGALVLCVGLLVSTVYLPGLSHVLKVTDPGIAGWTLVGIMSLIPFLFGQAVKGIGRGK